MERLPDSLEGSETFIFPSRTEMVQRAECSCSADGSRVGMELCTHSCIMCLGAHPHHTMLMYMFCMERAKRLQSPDKCAPAVSHCATL